MPVKESTWVRITISKIREIAERKLDALVGIYEVEFFTDGQDLREPLIERKITGARNESVEFNEATHRLIKG